MILHGLRLNEKVKLFLKPEDKQNRFNPPHSLEFTYPQWKVEECFI